MALYNLMKPRASALLRNIIRDPNLVALWPLNEQSGTIHDFCTLNTLDSSSVAGSPTYSQTVGQFYGLDFDGSNDYINLGDVSALDFEYTDAFSVVAVVSIDASNTAIISKYHTSAAPFGWMFVPGSDAGGTRQGQVILQNDSGVRIYVYTNADYALSTAIMVGFSYSGSGAASGVVMYLNGAVDPSTVLQDTLASNSIVSTAPANIGAFDSGSYKMNGKIGPVAVFSAAKTAADFKRWAALSGFL